MSDVILEIQIGRPRGRFVRNDRQISPKRCPCSYSPVSRTVGNERPATNPSRLERRRR